MGEQTSREANIRALKIKKVHGAAWES